MAGLICELLEARDFECVQYGSALPGLEELIASRPELIVIDVGLHPGREEQTGLQVIHAARSGSELRDVPIIVLVADMPSFEDAWGELRERGDVHRLNKPFNLDTFDRVVNTALGISQNEGGTNIARTGELDVRREQKRHEAEG